MRTYCRARGLHLMLCGGLNGKEVQRGGDVCISMAGAFCCAVDMDTML